MPSVVHVVTTENFAGVERYVSEVACETATRGWHVTVVGGDARRMAQAVGGDVRWLPGSTAATALASLARVGRPDVCHAHLTIAEAVAVAARPLLRAPILSTRHIAAVRGSSRIGTLLAPWIGHNLSRQIAVSEYVAEKIERRPDAVIPNGVRMGQVVWSPESRTVLVLQRLEREKDTQTALRAWREARLWEEGWTLRVVGDGAERRTLEAWVARERVPGVAFSGWSAHVEPELARAGILLAPAASDSFGFAVVEAMAAGVPVVACASGGHLETVGRLARAPTFPPGDAGAAASALRALLRAETRVDLSERGRALVEEHLTLSRHVDRLIEEYEHVLRRAPSGGLEELVVCSLEPWDEVWRRNQFFTEALLRRNPRLRVLFIEPPADPLHDLVNRRRPRAPRLRAMTLDRRLRAFRPVKPLPRRVGAVADRLLLDQVVLAARALRFSSPILWINDVTYAPLIERTGWAAVYDVTDDWLLAPFPVRELDRLRRLERVALRDAAEVVVCSPALAESRGRSRPVTLVPNAADVEHFRRPRSRPADLPRSPVAVYVGSLSEMRLDVDLLVGLARELPWVDVALVGPDALAPASRRRLRAEQNVHLLGERPYDDVPAYLQHADVILVPHVVTPFTDSLDPIKAYESLAVGTPTVATPVAGFKELADGVTIATRDVFTSAVTSVLRGDIARAARPPIPTWNDRLEVFERVLRRAREIAA